MQCSAYTEAKCFNILSNHLSNVNIFLSVNLVPIFFLLGTWAVSVTEQSLWPSGGVVYEISASKKELWLRSSYRGKLNDLSTLLTCPTHTHTQTRVHCTLSPHTDKYTSMMKCPMHDNSIQAEYPQRLIINLKYIILK